MAVDNVARGIGSKALQAIQGISVGGAPYIDGDNWYIWNGSGYVNSGIKAVGENGVGIDTIEYTSTTGLIDTYTITLENGYSTTFDVTNGKDGIDGKNGKDGTNGENGLNAYEVAVLEGFSGTITEWLDSLVGPTGPAGKDGINGKDGAAGKDGANGSNATINGKEAIEIFAGANISIANVPTGIEISSTGGSGGTSDYRGLENKPTLNGIEIIGNKTSSDYGIIIPDVSTLATKTELEQKQNKLSNEQLENINSIPLKADKTYVDTELENKQDLLSTEQIENINNINEKADKTYVDTELAKKQNSLTSHQITNINNIDNKADKTYVDTELEKKQYKLSDEQIININSVPNKQNKLVAGDNIIIDQDTNTISATGAGGTTYIATPEYSEAVAIASLPYTADANVLIIGSVYAVGGGYSLKINDTISLDGQTNDNISIYLSSGDTLSSTVTLDTISLFEVPVAGIEVGGDYSSLIDKPSINGNTLVGNKTSEELGIEIPDISNLATKEELNNKQDTLVSGTNIKTINNQSLMGTGNINIEGGSGISDAPVDGKTYGRNNATWQEITASSGESIFAFEIVEGDLILIYPDSSAEPNIYIEGNNLIWEVE